MEKEREEWGAGQRNEERKYSDEEQDRRLERENDGQGAEQMDRERN